MSAIEGSGAEGTRVLLLVNDPEDGWGSSAEPVWARIRDACTSLGWEMDVVSPTGGANPDALGRRAFPPIRSILDIQGVEPYEAIILLPGSAQETLTRHGSVQKLLHQARAQGRVIATCLESSSLSDSPPPRVVGNVVTGFWRDHHSALMVDAIRIAISNARVSRNGSEALAAARPEDMCFAFPLEPGSELKAITLAASLRWNGGALSACRLAALAPGTWQDEITRRRLESLGVEILAWEPDSRLQAIPFAEKAGAAKAAEIWANVRGCEALVWMDQDSYVLREPSEFVLPVGTALAFRPVHHRLIGSLADESPGSFWSTVYAFCGVDLGHVFPVISSIDRQRIRFYPNAGCLSLRPARGILNAWHETLIRVSEHQEFARLMAQDALQGIFLHQALLSAVLLREVPQGAMRELSFVYNYPLHLHGKTPETLRPATVEELVTVRYEHFEVLEGMAMSSTTRHQLSQARHPE